MKALKALSALLTYPSAELVAAAGDIRVVLDAEPALAETERAALRPLFAELAATDLMELQERYVLLFDRTRSLSLHLFEHVHGESRDRGQAMVDLQNVYAQAGFAIGCAELPDYLPLFLEYGAQLAPDEARALLAEAAHVLQALGARLRQKNSHYAAVLAALVAIAGAEPSAQAMAALADVPDIDPQDFGALDAVWEEEEVRFGPGAAAGECGVDSLAARLRQARRPAPGLATIAATRGPRTAFTRTSSRV